MRTEPKHLLVVAIIVIIATINYSVATLATESSIVCARTLPENMVLPPGMERVLMKIYQTSATFRAQCERIAAARALSVTIRLDAAIPRSCLAFTLINRRGHIVHADVHLPPAGTMMAELVGHEFEHIVEQLDGLNLRVLAHVHGSGVRESAFEVYESDRAQRAGRTVAAESRSAD
jgi:hypothetical protein